VERRDSRVAAGQPAGRAVVGEPGSRVPSANAAADPGRSYAADGHRLRERQRGVEFGAYEAAVPALGAAPADGTTAAARRDAASASWASVARVR